MRHYVRDYNPRPTALHWIAEANAICKEYSAYNLTLRQLHYQFVSRNIYENTPDNYKTLGKTLMRAREAGKFSWNHMVDRARQRHSHPTHGDPDDYAKRMVQSYRIDMWANQEFHVEVIVEKQALEEVALMAADPYRVPVLASLGSGSATTKFEIANYCLSPDKHNIVIYLGDHDPSGIVIGQDWERKLTDYACKDLSVELRRIALTREQVEEYKLPPNFTKETDPNTKTYYERFGHKCPSWELDALEPDRTRKLIADEIQHWIDPTQWAVDQAHELDQIAYLRSKFS